METYKEFLDRINSFEKKRIYFGDSYFKVNSSVTQKVNKDNTFANFYGDTVVFALDDTVKKKLDAYTELLYRTAPQCFCQRLSADTFHLTLHDLCSSPSLNSVAEELVENELKIKQTAKALIKYENTKIRVKSNCIFNMVDTSLVVGLYPADEDGYCRLLELYGIFDGIKKLNYLFTPHITLAYYNFNGFDLPSARILEDEVNRLNDNGFEFELNLNNLSYQRFKSMNDYTDILRLVKHHT